MSEKVTVYAAILNEGAGIRSLLDSLLGQSRLPDEILIVDGGSTDGTSGVIAEYARQSSLLKVVNAPGTNIAQARNIARLTARHDLIASIDGGCVADRDWLKNLLSSLDDDVDIVSGTYALDPSSAWNEVLSSFFYPDPLKLPENWKQPSHRSILVRKRAHQIVGTFPEHLNRSEDSWFNEQAAKKELRFRLARNAIVYWLPRKNLVEVFTNSYSWVKSDIANNVDMPFQWNRAIRFTVRLIGKIGGLLLWTLAVVWFPLAALLLSPVVFAFLLKVSHRMKSFRHFILYNAMDYTVMAATAAGLAGGEFDRITRRRPH